MARDYSAEYERRNERARERGFSGYGQERRARREVRAEIELAQERDIPVLLPDPRTSAGQDAYEAILAAKAEIYNRGLKGNRGADKADRLSPEVRDKLRELFPDNNVYYPLMRGLY